MTIKSKIIELAKSLGVELEIDADRVTASAPDGHYFPDNGGTHSLCLWDKTDAGAGINWRHVYNELRSQPVAPCSDGGCCAGHDDEES
jgi:hypothetical protein